MSTDAPAAEPHAGHGRHRRTTTAGANWTWTLVVGIAYTVAAATYGVLQVVLR